MEGLNTEILEEICSVEMPFGKYKGKILADLCNKRGGNHIGMGLIVKCSKLGYLFCGGNGDAVLLNRDYFVCERVVSDKDGLIYIGCKNQMRLRNALLRKLKRLYS